MDKDSSSALTPSAQLALWLVAGGIAKPIVAQRVGYTYGYVRKLAASPTGRAFIDSVQDEARREIGVALAVAS